jgi:hypothetical protein
MITAAHRVPEPAPSWVGAYLVGLAWVATAISYLVVTW